MTQTTRITETDHILNVMEAHAALISARDNIVVAAERGHSRTSLANLAEKLQAAARLYHSTLI